MDNIDILTMLYKIDTKVDAISAELNRGIISTAVLQERIANTCAEVNEIKYKVIPDAIATSVDKTQLWIYGSICVGATSLIATILMKVL